MGTTSTFIPTPLGLRSHASTSLVLRMVKHLTIYHVVLGLIASRFALGTNIFSRPACGTGECFVIFLGNKTFHQLPLTVTQLRMMHAWIALGPWFKFILLPDVYTWNFIPSGVVLPLASGFVFSPTSKNVVFLTRLGLHYTICI